MAKVLTLFLLFHGFLLLCAQTPPPAQDRIIRPDTFGQTGREVDGFLERFRGKISYSWFKCREHFSLMFTAVGDKAKHGERDLKTRARLKSGELSEQALEFGREAGKKALDFGRETREKGQDFYQEKSEVFSDDIAEKTRKIQEELRNAGTEFQRTASEKANDAADAAAKEILD